MKPKKNTMVGVTKLEPRKWLCGVEKARLLNLLWVPHFHCGPITILVIRQLLCLVHGRCLWLEEPIPITEHLIQCITWLPCKGEDPVVISQGKSSDLAIAEAMKKKYKLEKKKRGYIISNINNKAIRVVTQILASEVIHKCSRDEVLAPVVAHAE